MSHKWKERPKGFLADFTSQYNDERLDYIIELHQVIWKLLKLIGVSWSGNLKDCVITTFEKLQGEGEELSQEKIAEICTNKKYDCPSSPDTLVGHVYQKGWVDCFEHYSPKTKYEWTRKVLEEFLRKVSWFMWDKKTMQNIINWINEQENQ